MNAARKVALAVMIGVVSGHYAVLRVVLKTLGQFPVNLL